MRKSGTKNKSANRTPAQKEFETFRHDIYKLGLTGLEKKDRVDARYELAIKLGAKPKKWIKPMRKLGEASAELKRKETEQKQQREHGKAGEIGEHTKTNTTSSTRSSQRSRS